MAVEELGPAERIVAGAVGEPGQRRFYFQILSGGRPTTLLAEKTQVAALAEQGLAILAERGVSSEREAVDRLVADGLPIEDPGEGNERFRVGEISISLGGSELLMIEIVSIDENDGVSFVIAPEQFQAMAHIALEVVQRGRPLCEWCQLPMNPDGHQCPSRNGHHRQ
ncbi:MAG TPA: DUF3090 family protein [Acidimicrobiia bacterium]|nr:DUF3090 family protein [Acidimicrobiia bacterium]